MAERTKKSRSFAERTLQARVREGLDAMNVLRRLSDNPADDAEWNRQAANVRLSLKWSALLPADTDDDILAKAHLLASVVYREGEVDQRYRLAQSLLEDIAKKGK